MMVGIGFFAATVAAACLLFPLLLCSLFALACRLRASWRRRRRGVTATTTTVAFFHPRCSSGGGGERVLWKTLQVLLLQSPQKEKGSLRVLIYTVDPPTPRYAQDLLKHVKDRFSIDLTATESMISFVHLHQHVHLLDPSRHLSLLVESLRTMQLAWKALTYGNWSLLPDVFVDTTGYAFSYFVARLCMGCQVWAYVHYPTISTDMLRMVWERRRAAYNHATYIAQSPWATLLKLVYYCLFAVLYGCAGSLAHVVLVNSTWTYRHIRSLWKLAAWRGFIQIVYPPCQVSNLQDQEHPSTQQQQQRQRLVLSIGQFRPEKDHVLQIEALVQLYQRHPKWKGQVQLVLLGSCRGESDQERLQHLQGLAAQHKLETNAVEFVVNQPYAVVQQWLSKASMGIHTMWNEHFGIGIVEMMAAGLVVVAHDSGGPQSDIIDTAATERTGFLASTPEQYAECIHSILTMEDNEVEQIRKRAAASSSRFSDEVFANEMAAVMAANLPSIA